MHQRGNTIPKEWQSWPRDLPLRALTIRCCDHCSHFEPDRINPAAGIGGCDIGKGNHYPMEQHNCSDFDRAHK